jgi:hypothetical protein
MTKAIFESLDTHGTSGIAEASGEQKYTGVERRRGHRRSGKDRRAEVRFDPNSISDRRQNKGRRETDRTPDFF